jgi:hypothetical protein
MKKDLANTTISCHLFKKHQAVLISKNNSINNSVRPIEKSIFAEELTDTANRMLDCSEFDNLQLDCNTCHSIARSQKKIAETHFGIKKTA